MFQLKYQRIRRGIKQIEFAKRIGLSPAYVSAIENKRAEPSDNFKRKASALLRVPQKYLFIEV